MSKMEDHRLSRAWLPLTFLLSAILPVVYLVLLTRGGFAGFPLDDAWIHQTYARNLVELGEWSYIPGQPSAGSTAPLWSLLLAVGHALSVEPLLWVALLGLVTLWGTGWLSASWGALRLGANSNWPLIISILILFEWHLIWAGLSGMETLLVAFIAVALFYLLEVNPSRYLLAGLLVGLAVWLRPDGLSLILPVLWCALHHRSKGKNPLNALGRLAVGIALPLLLYFLFHVWLVGDLLPNTFYSKQAEYALLREAPLWYRLIRQLGVPLELSGYPRVEAGGPMIGVGTLLLPGLFYFGVNGLRTQEWRKLAPLLWVMSYIGVFALRLPLTYQHGRYVIPVIPVWIVLGVEGTHLWWIRKSDEGLTWVIKRTWLLVTMIVLLVFAILGARAYLRDVRFIESQMVSTAKWIAEHTDPRARIAAHDIGALGYHGHREIIDLAGLISPETIPLLGDEAAMAAYLSERGADYLMVFPSWYSFLVRDLPVIYQAESEGTSDPMIVYRWR